MKNRILIISVLSVLSFVGCLDDKTNLDYKDVILPDSVIVTNVANQQKFYFDEESAKTFKVTSGEELQLDVEVKYRGDDELTYEWRFDGKVVSREQNLRYVCTEEAQAMLLIYRKRAGNATVYQFMVNIRAPFNTGVVVLGKKDGKTELDFIERYWEKKTVELDGRVYNNFSVTEYIPHENVYPLYNDNEELGANPIMITRYGKQYYALQILDKDWRSSVAINSSDMKKIVSMKDEFVGDPDNLKPVNFVRVGATSLLLDESGKIYTRVNYDDGNPNTGRFITEPLVFDDPYDVPDKGSEVIKAQYIEAKDQLAVIYEKEKKRFLAMTASTGSYQSIDYSVIYDLSRPSNAGNLPKGYIDMNNFDKEVIAILFHESFWNDNVYVLYKDGGDYYIQAAGIKTDVYGSVHRITYTAVSNVKLPADAAGLIEQGKGLLKLAMDDSYNDFLYVGAGKALYSMSMEGTSIKQIYAFEEEGNMTDFVITATWRGEGYNAAQRYFNGQVFAAAFDNGDCRVIKLYADPQKPGEIQKKYWYNKRFDGGVVSLYYY